MINVTSEPQIQLTQQDSAFVELICNRITAYGMIPYSVPRKLVVGVIQQSARLFFRYAYHRSQEHRAFAITRKSLEEYLNKSYKLSDSGEKIKIIGIEIQLPSWVNVVKEVYECNKSSNFTVQEMTNSISYMQNTAPYGQSLMGINNNLYIQEIAAKMTEVAVTQAIFSKGIMFHFNPATHKIIFYEGKMEHSVVLDCEINTGIDSLYVDDLFQRHVIAETKRELKRIIGGHTVQLPGDVTLNVDEICNNIEDSEKVEELVKNSSGIGHVILQR